MELKLYDTLSREKRVFVPLDPKRVRMYVCGPTVYDYAHIGNARPVIVFDVLFRLLRHIYGAEHVTYVRNVTDVDDKINARAAERGISIRELTEETYRNFKADVAALGCLPPTVEPRATEHIEQMKTLIERLVVNGCAYVAEDHVLFHVAAMKDYGQLAHRSLDELIAGARVEVAPYKKDPMDFVLWKPSKPGEPAWPSPCGIAVPGRPGWHIECSAMAWKHLGETFDIHGGGIDLVFPHHENEIAQSRCAFHTPVMANYWMHNGFLQVEGEKMSKSLGNFVTIHELLTDWPGEVIRLNMLRTHYREPIDWTLKGLEESARVIDSWRAAYDDVEMVWERPRNIFVAEALCDDLNTPLAIHHLHEFHKKIKSNGDALYLADNLAFLGLEVDFLAIRKDLQEKFAHMDFQSIAIAQQASLNEFAKNIDHATDAWKEAGIEKYAAKGIRLRDLMHVARLRSEHGIDINQEIDARNSARKAKNFKESDRIRDELAAMGVVLKDSKDGTTWEIAR
jgi:cysteinyl-tRNA synthetase